MTPGDEAEIVLPVVVDRAMAAVAIASAAVAEISGAALRISGPTTENVDVATILRAKRPSAPQILR